MSSHESNAVHKCKNAKMQKCTMQKCAMQSAKCKNTVCHRASYCMVHVSYLRVPVEADEVLRRQGRGSAFRHVTIPDTRYSVTYLFRPPTVPPPAFRPLRWRRGNDRFPLRHAQPPNSSPRRKRTHSGKREGRKRVRISHWDGARNGMIDHGWIIHHPAPAPKGCPSIEFDQPAKPDGGT